MEKFFNPNQNNSEHIKPDATQLDFDFEDNKNTEESKVLTEAELKKIQNEDSVLHDKIVEEMHKNEQHEESEISNKTNIAELRQAIEKAYEEKEEEDQMSKKEDPGEEYYGRFNKYKEDNTDLKNLKLDKDNYDKNKLKKKKSKYKRGWYPRWPFDPFK